MKTKHEDNYPSLPNPTVKIKPNKQRGPLQRSKQNSTRAHSRRNHRCTLQIMQHSRRKNKQTEIILKLIQGTVNGDIKIRINLYNLMKDEFKEGTQPSKKQKTKTKSLKQLPATKQKRWKTNNQTYRKQLRMPQNEKTKNTTNNNSAENNYKDKTITPITLNEGKKCRQI